jgi:hypothetical protein
MSRAYEIARDLILALEAQHRCYFDFDAVAEDARHDCVSARHDPTAYVRRMSFRREGVDRVEATIKAAMREASGSAP